jgi:hypothetical protein
MMLDIMADGKLVSRLLVDVIIIIVIAIPR